MWYRDEPGGERYWDGYCSRCGNVQKDPYEFEGLCADCWNEDIDAYEAWEKEHFVGEL